MLGVNILPFKYLSNLSEVKHLLALNWVIVTLHKTWDIRVTNSTVWMEDWRWRMHFHLFLPPTEAEWSLNPRHIGLNNDPQIHFLHCLTAAAETPRGAEASNLFLMPHSGGDLSRSALKSLILMFAINHHNSVTADCNNRRSDEHLAGGFQRFSERAPLVLRVEKVWRIPIPERPAPSVHTRNRKLVGGTGKRLT